MNQTRRDFFRNLGTKSAGAAASIAAPALLHAEALTEQIHATAKDLNNKINENAAELNGKIKETTSEIKDQVHELGVRLDTTALLLSYRQAQIHLIFLLLVISFAIDGGMAFFWLL